MRIFVRDYVHKTLSPIRVSVFEEPRGFLVTEDRQGTATTVATLGLYPSRDKAILRAEERGVQLLGQRYRPATPAA